MYMFRTYPNSLTINDRLSWLRRGNKLERTAHASHRNGGGIPNISERPEAHEGVAVVSVERHAVLLSIPIKAFSSLKASMIDVERKYLVTRSIKEKSP